MASRMDQELQRDYHRLKFRRRSAAAKVAITRKLAVRPFDKLRAVSEVEPLYWKLRQAAQPVPPAPMQGSPARPVVPPSGIEKMMERPAPLAGGEFEKRIMVPLSGIE